LPSQAGQGGASGTGEGGLGRPAAIGELHAQGHGRRGAGEGHRLSDLGEISPVGAVRKGKAAIASDNVGEAELTAYVRARMGRIEACYDAAAPEPQHPGSPSPSFHNW
jgi:hypothetical protein